MNGPPPRSLWPRTPPWLIVLVAVVLVGFLIYQQLAPPGDPREALQEAYEDFVEAFLDRDRDELWDMETEEFKQFVEKQVESLRGLPPSDPAFQGSVFTWAMIQAGSVQVAMYPDGFFNEYEPLFRSLVLESVSVEDNIGNVSCTSEDRRYHLEFRLEDGEWKVRSFSSVTMRFMTLARKLETPLPRHSERSVREIHAVVQVGASGLNERDSGKLGRIVEQLVHRVGRDEIRVVLEVPADASIQVVIEALDLLLAAGVERIWFADTRESNVPDRIAINGVSLVELGDTDPPALEPDHPILGRVIGLR